MFQTPEMVKTALESLYRDTAMVITEVDAMDDNGIVTTSTQTAGPYPCRLSYKDLPSADTGDSIAGYQQTTKMFLSVDVTIPAGAFIDITHMGKVLHFKAAGVPAGYSFHQEVTLEERSIRNA